MDYGKYLTVWAAGLALIVGLIIFSVVRKTWQDADDGSEDDEPPPS